MKKRILDEYPIRAVRSEIRYFDDDHNPVPRDGATWAVFREVDENGALLFEAQGFID
ncbi:MAG: hypothetical protein PHW87_13135 [Methanothrix sp.]|nr:hypothetical protein [Methanothrix sp.]